MTSVNQSFPSLPQSPPVTLPGDLAAPSMPAGQIVLHTTNLTKRYGQRLAVNGLNLDVVRGEVFGFLGPNGAGKTTTIRMLLNLIRPTTGEVQLFGERLTPGSARTLLPRVGALIEQPAFQSYLSGRDNLIAVGGYTGGVPVARVDEVLDIIGLGGRGRDRYSAYSLGMRQRLGVGAALLTDPELIILDEPGNGLDPAGIVEMRALVKQLVQQGKTIFLSSHILAEVRQMCTRIGIVRSGQLIASGEVNQLLRSNSRWEIEVDQPEQVCQMLARVPELHSATVEQGLVIINAPKIHGRDILRYLVPHGVWPESIRRSEEDLEHIFLRLTEREVGL